MTPVVGFIGAGHQVQVYARRDEVRDRLKQQGAALADSPADLASGSDILIACLFSDAQLTEAGLGPNGFVAQAKPGAVLVSHTTGLRSTLDELTAAGSALTILDAPVSGTVENIEAGTLTVLIGGTTDAVRRVTPVLSAYASPIIATGDVGTALDIKLINNLLFSANAQLVTAATELGQRLGVAPTSLFEALMVCSGGSRASAHAYRIGGMAAFADRAGPFLRKDIAACLEAATEAGVDLGLLGTVVETGPLHLTNGDA
jgi:3-hydroxyisobutyrate dehydrogenase-like beta-hydroxyacid dehydrogenase